MFERTGAWVFALDQAQEASRACLFSQSTVPLAGRLRIDTWPVVVAYKVFPNMFLENYCLNAPVDVGGPDFL